VTGDERACHQQQEGRAREKQNIPMKTLTHGRLLIADCSIGNPKVGNGLSVAGIGISSAGIISSNETG